MTTTMTVTSNAELDAEGFDQVLQRAANIILNVTERQISKILHVYPENNLTAFIGEVRLEHIVLLLDWSMS